MPLRHETGAVVVLGFANAGARINMVNRWRARVAVRSAAASDHCAIICSGGAVRGAVSEAELLSRFIREDLAWKGTVRVEDASTSTWENVRNVVPMLEDVDWIAFASGSLHAEKAREYLRRQRPDLAMRLAPVPEYRFGEMSIVKPLFAVVGLWKLRALRS
ncbi:ElyC/SanA/YdcF family protein [Curtobacterium sp. PhB115]|uniref:ElyC/SanA/YdcF family protein n=1 Tax=Curtobacterium sp. PhB115 TaxID=2485173 RepID=UPI000F4CFBD7|nr:ElyC/SanA/YdcF family protein [Curtobacterium sp. PhB115]